MLRTVRRDAVIERVDELLEALYASTPLGNVQDPLDELIYIILSIQTGPNSYQPVFDALKRRFPKWESILQVSEGQVERIIRPAGLSQQKSRHIRGIVERVLAEARTRSGNPSTAANLDFLVSESDEAAEAFLLSLPGVSVKTARCVLMYALGRRVFPVDTHIHRIFTRMGIVDAVHRKRAADPIQNVVSPKFRHRLHVNLIHHGRAVCTAQTPKCSACPLISFCKTGLDHCRSASKPSRVAVDLFAGPGGLSVGFERAGYAIAFAADVNRYAAQTYRLNHPGVPTFETDITSLDGKDILDITGLAKGGVDVLIGGPPCQGYSQAGKRNPSHPDNKLYRHFARLGRELGARLLVMENVPGIRNVRGRAFVKAIRTHFARRQFKAREFLLDAASYGVPQHRQRILFLAARRGSRLSEQLSAPPATSRVETQPTVTEALPAAPTVGEALRGLPRRNPGEGSEVEAWLGKPLYNHVAMVHSREVVAKIREIRAGEGPISYRRLASEKPARTIIAGHRALPVHPVEHRTITAREAARLQSFDDDFRFLGPRGEQPLQIANAVPPRLAEAIARHAKRWLESSDR